MAGGVIPVDPDTITLEDAWQVAGMLVQAGRVPGMADWCDDLKAEKSAASLAALG